MACLAARPKPTTFTPTPEIVTSDKEIGGHIFYERLRHDSGHVVMGKNEASIGKPIARSTITKLLGVKLRIPDSA